MKQLSLNQEHYIVQFNESLHKIKGPDDMFPPDDGVPAYPEAGPRTPTPLLAELGCSAIAARHEYIQVTAARMIEQIDLICGLVAA